MYVYTYVYTYVYIHIYTIIYATLPEGGVYELLRVCGLKVREVLVYAALRYVRY